MEAAFLIEVESRTALCRNPAHEGEEEDIVDARVKDCVQAEMAVRDALDALRLPLPPFMGGACRRVGPGQRLSEDGDEIVVPWRLDGVPQPDARFPNTDEGRIEADQFVLEHCSKAVRHAELRANLATARDPPVTVAGLPHPPGPGAAAAWRARPRSCRRTARSTRRRPRGRRRVSPLLLRGAADAAAARSPHWIAPEA